MVIRTFGHNYEIDLHGMTVSDAKRELTLLLNRAGKDCHEIEVIHGYTGGTALRDFVRREFTHPRIERKFLSLNQGITTLILKRQRNGETQ